MALTDKLTAIADAIRGKTGKADTLTLDQMATEIASIQSGGDSGGGSLETCSVKLINLTTTILAAWYSVVSNGTLSSTMNQVNAGEEMTITNVPRNSVFSFLPMGGSMGSIHYQNDLVNAMLVSSCEHLGAVVVGTNGTEVSVTVNAPTA